MFEHHRLAELMKSEAFRKGQSTRREVLGENYVDNSLSKVIHIAAAADWINP
jgi:hypothetical protein